MERHHEVSLSQLPATEILPALIRFADDTDLWQPTNLQTDDSTIEPFCLITLEVDPVAALSFVTHAKRRRVELTNVVPRDVSSLSIAQYNEIADRFVREFRQFNRREQLGIKINRTVFKLSLETAIPGRKCREVFERYLSLSPLSYHPNDMKRLDRFIRNVHSFGTRLDLPALQAWLCQQPQWTPDDSAKVCERIQIGLDVLRAYER